MLDNRFLAKSLGLLSPPLAPTVLFSQSLADAIALLQEHKNGAVLVVDEQDILQGILTERDVVLKVVNKGVDISVTPVSEFMTVEPATASMTTSVAYALNMMSVGGFRNIPIVDEKNRPVGLLSVKNLVDFLARSIGKLSQ
jgi:CBS domain-containing protein